MKVLQPLAEMQLVSAVSIEDVEDGGGILYQVRRHQGAAESPPVVQEMVTEKLEKNRLYMLAADGTPWPLLPVGVFKYDNKTERYDMYLPKTLETKVGKRMKLLGLMTGGKATVAVS